MVCDYDQVEQPRRIEMVLARIAGSWPSTRIAFALRTGNLDRSDFENGAWRRLFLRQHLPRCD
jgi:hypothetical protein